ncbi:MAG TPA: hypothetical protein PKE66_17870, partial [Pyrinomonadaceae bacterium]|nr:hypothetical protein [Pyrinomonadaceae bacterium]
MYRDSGAVERYVDALCREIGLRKPARQQGLNDQQAGQALPNGRASAFVDTIYFGGGTPSLLEPGQVEKIIKSVNSVFSVAKDAEITM